MFRYFLTSSEASFNMFFMFDGFLSITALLLMSVFLENKLYIPKGLQSIESSDK